MDVSQDRDARVMSVIFAQLEMLGELAVKAGETGLAADLQAVLVNALFRYADAGGRPLGGWAEERRKAG